MDLLPGLRVAEVLVDVVVLGGRILVRDPDAGAVLSFALWYRPQPCCQSLLRGVSGPGDGNRQGTAHLPVLTISPFLGPQYTTSLLDTLAPPLGPRAAGPVPAGAARPKAARPDRVRIVLR